MGGYCLNAELATIMVAAIGVVSFALVVAIVNAAKQRTIVVTAIVVAAIVGFDCRSTTEVGVVAVGVLPAIAWRQQRRC